MRMRRLNSLLLILVALWLPLQTAAAWAMPFCRHAAERVEPVDAQQAMASGAHCHELEDAAHDPQRDGFNCDNCAMCHLASAGYLPAAVVEPISSAASVLVTQPILTLPSHIGDPPQQPPRRTN